METEDSNNLFNASNQFNSSNLSNDNLLNDNNLSDNDYLLSDDVQPDNSDVQQQFEDCFDELDEDFFTQLLNDPSPDNLSTLINRFNPSNINVEDQYLNKLKEIKSNRPEISLEALSYIALELNEFYREKFNSNKLDKSSFNDFDKAARSKKFKKNAPTIKEEHHITGLKKPVRCYYNNLEQTFKKYLTNDTIAKQYDKEKKSKLFLINNLIKSLNI